MGLDSDARRRGLIEYLSLNGYATMRQLAGEFDVSINTIQRDITYLARYYPLETAYGRYGGGTELAALPDLYDTLAGTCFAARNFIGSGRGCCSAAGNTPNLCSEIAADSRRNLDNFISSTTGTFPPKRATLESTP